MHFEDGEALKLYVGASLLFCTYVISDEDAAGKTYAVKDFCRACRPMVSVTIHSELIQFAAVSIRYVRDGMFITRSQCRPSGISFMQRLSTVLVLSHDGVSSRTFVAPMVRMRMWNSVCSHA